MDTEKHTAKRGRPKVKDSELISIRMDTSILSKVNVFCDESGLTRTKVIERAVLQYIETHRQKSNDSANHG